MEQRQDNDFLWILFGLMALVGLLWFAMRDDVAAFSLLISKVSFFALQYLHGHNSSVIWASLCSFSVLMTALAYWKRSKVAVFLVLISLALGISSFVLNTTIGKTLIWTMYPVVYQSPDILPQVEKLYFSLDPKFMTGTDIINHYEFGGFLLRWPVTLLSMLSMYTIFINSKVQRSTRRFNNVNELFEYSQEQFPHLKPALQQKLHKKDPDVGLYRREESPIRFAIKQGIVSAHTRNKHGEMSENDFPVSFKRKRGHIVVRDHMERGIVAIHDLCVFNEEQANSVFKMQVGKRFTDVYRMSTARKAMLAVFVLFAKGGDEKKAAFSLLEQFNRSWDHSKVHNKKATELLKEIDDTFIDSNGVNEVFEQYWEDEEFVELRESHFYETTLLCGALELARTKGKLFDSFWYWLMPVDRELYWALDSLGGQTTWTECSGIISHYKTELFARQKLANINVSSAVKGLKSYLDETEGWLMSSQTKAVLQQQIEEEAF